MLSIIIPSLNEEKYLPLLLDSIKKQDFFDYEIIVADAKSTDKTLEVAKKYNCKIVPGGLPGIARNNGAKIAKGEIILFLDADFVLPHPNFFTNALEEFEKRKLGVAAFPLLPIGGKKIDKTVLSSWNKLAELTENFLPHAAAAIMAKKEVHEKMGGFDESIIFVEDHPYARAAAKFSKFGFIKNEPIFISVRRYEKDGRLKTYVKCVLAGLHTMFIGPVKSDIFNYRFDHYDENTNNKK